MQVEVYPDKQITRFNIDKFKRRNHEKTSIKR